MGEIKTNEILQITADKISTLTGYKSEEIAIIKSAVAKGTTNAELAYFISVCKSVELNPLMKEIWCYKDGKGNLLVFAGRDGFLKKAQQSELWNGMTSFEVCANDFFEMDVTRGEIKHSPNFKDRGEIIGAYAIVKPKGCELPTVEWAPIAIYDKKMAVWNSHKADMIKKVAEVHALKKAFGMTILQSEYDYNVRGEVVEPLDNDIESELAKKIIDALDKYTGNDKEDIRSICVEKMKAGEFDIEFARNIGKQLGLEI